MEDVFNVRNGAQPGFHGGVTRHEGACCFPVMDAEGRATEIQQAAFPADVGVVMVLYFIFKLVKASHHTHEYLVVPCFWYHLLLFQISKLENIFYLI